MRLDVILARVGVLLAALLLASTVVAGEARESTRLAVPQPTETPGRIEVIEFFWYGCPHCNDLEPKVAAWEKRLPKDVAFRREHVIWPGRSEIEVHARLFLTLRAMNLLERHHGAVFAAIHKAKAQLRDERQVADWAAQQGIDRKKFVETYKSFGVQTQMGRARERTWNYSVEGVPSFAVNGKYMATLGGAQDPDKLFVTLDRLIAGERGKP